MAVPGVDTRSGDHESPRVERAAEKVGPMTLACTSPAFARRSAAYDLGAEADLVNQRSAGAGGSPLGAFRHGDCPAATGQDDSGRWRASSVMSTKPLFRIESIRLVVKRHGSPSLFFKGRCYPHLILGFGILRPQAVVRHSKLHQDRNAGYARMTANPRACRGSTCADRAEPIKCNSGRKLTPANSAVNANNHGLYFRVRDRATPSHRRRRPEHP